MNRRFCVSFFMMLMTQNAAAYDICDQIRDAAEKAATTKAEEMRAYREYQECKRNLRRQEDIASEQQAWYNESTINGGE